MTVADGPERPGDAEARFVWDYARTDERLRALYERGKAAQWNATTDIDWAAGVGTPGHAGLRGRDLPLGREACPVPSERWAAFHWEFHSWMTSQFLHGEQGALLATGRLVAMAPDLDTKFYAAAQVADEARHVEAYARYVGLLGNEYPVNPSLKRMLDTVVTESRWDIVFLGMQIIVEGLALAAFRLEHTRSFDPVIARLTRLVARDEARHVAFGRLALREIYGELTSREKAEREEFVKDAALLMSRRFRLEEIWRRLDVDVRAGTDYALQDRKMIDFRRLMFTKIVTSLAGVGLLTPGVRAHLEQLQLLRTVSRR
ncbi:ferritin-like domain-containing protein [Actinomadura madurae]|uniref:ferritin-like domain-containing protein n=1 Tax=Actinomadura madurae TaxID=1993 RepID=UPI000D8DF9E6|nr:ferritin-like domain-containing protein [Actinomadura madurae]SPT51710.1 ribonucleotide-diphosphate reductase subunit beta [Actinomadura madurae]